MGRVTMWFGAILYLAVSLSAQDQDFPAKNLDSLSLEELMQVKVQGAALHPQTLRDAPASVTIITAEEISKYGYRTLGEALASVRGFYLNDNRTYESLGVRGFGAPDDYDSHVLVMINGHSMTDNIFGYMLFLGNDFPLDLNLIKQIEIIRGPSSALYGTNGMFATINIVTKTPDEAAPASLTTTLDSFGEKKGQIAASQTIGKNAQVLVSGSVYNNSGESPLYFPEFNSPQTNYGEAIDMNGERGYHLFSNLVWRNWTILALFSGNDKIQPISWGPTIFDDRGTQNYATRNFVDAAYARDIWRGTLRWRTYYDEQRYLGRFDYPLEPPMPLDAVEDNRELINGKWTGSELTYRTDLGIWGAVTAGVDAKLDIRAILTDFDVTPAPATFLSIDRPDRNVAFLLQDEHKLSRNWTLDLGARYDKSTLLHDFVSPRLALIYQPRGGWTYKFLYGRSFRNPSLFQLFDGDGHSAIANPSLRPESGDQFEADAERKIGKRWSFLTAAYGYQLYNYIDGFLTGSQGLIQYRNEGTLRAGGVEVEVSGKPAAWLEFTASYAIQRTQNLGHGGVLENSPEHLGKLHFAIPLGRKFQFSSGMQYTGAVVSLAEQRVSPVLLADVSLISRKLSNNFDFTLGVRNAFNRSYSDPVALNPMVDTMLQPGRSVFVELIPHRAR